MRTRAESLGPGMVPGMVPNTWRMLRKRKRMEG